MIDSDAIGLTQGDAVDLGDVVGGWDRCLWHPRGGPTDGARRNNSIDLRLGETPWWQDSSSN